MNFKFWNLRNFVVFFKIDNKEPMQRNRYLILNLATRKEFWIRVAIVASEIREKSGRLDWHFKSFRAVGMLPAENDRLKIRFRCQIADIHADIHALVALK